MKAFSIVMKVIVALAAVAGAVYLVATYGDKIAAWAKKTLKSCPLCNRDICEEDFEDDFVPAGAEETPAEAPAEETAEEPADQGAVVAADADFEG